MKRLYTMIRSYLHNSEIDINERLSTFFIYMGVFAAILGTLVNVAAHASIYGILSTALIAVGAPIVAAVSQLSGRRQVFGVVIAIGLSLILPVVWLSSGGTGGGVNVWFVYELFYIALFTTPKKLPYFAIPATLLIIGCFVLESTRPELVFHFASTHDTCISLLGSILIVSVTIIITELVQKSLYNEEHAINEKQEDFTLNFVMSIASIIDAKDSYTGGHSKRVAYCATEIGRRMGMTEDELNNLHTVALLHDIGKIGIPDSILNNPGALSDQEFEMIRQHPVIGGKIVKELTFIPHVTEGVMYHHERYDGRGYPSGLKGEEIPLLARLICVADAFDAMSTNRVYRKRLDSAAIIKEFNRCKNTQFDPYITDVFVSMLQEGFMVDAEKVSQTNIEEEMSLVLEKLVTSVICKDSGYRKINLPPKSFRGNLKKDYPEYAQISDFLRNLGHRFDDTFVPTAIVAEVITAEKTSESAMNSIMRSLSTAIRGTIRSVDVCTRYNPNTFLIILVNARTENLQAVYDRIEASFSKTDAAVGARLSFRLMEEPCRKKAVS